MARPLQQGQLDSLCGVYAVLNAVNYLHGPLRQTRLKLLFELSLRQLATQRGVIERMIRYGTIGRDLSGLLQLVNQHYRIDRRKPFHLQPTIEWERFWFQCRQFLRHPHTIILIAIGGTHEHWTLVYRMSAHTLYLYDSCQMKRLAKRHCQMAHEPLQTKAHHIYPTHTYFLRKPL